MIEIHFNEYTLRSLKEEDADSMSRNANDAEVSKYLRDSFPYPYKKENALQWIKFSLEQNVDLLLGIANKEEVIGGIGAHPNSDVHRFTAEVGFWLGKDYWNRGITSGALRAFCKYLFTNFNFNRLTANVFEGNEASKKVLEKCGFSLEGIHPESVYKNGKFTSHYSYGLLKKDFKYDS